MEPNRNIKRSMKSFYALARPYKHVIGLLLLLVLAVEVTNILEKYLLKIVIDSGTSYSQSLIASSTLVQLMAGVALAFITLVIVRSMLKFAHIHLINNIDANIIVDLKRKFFNHIVGLSHSFHTTHKTGSMISRLSRGAGAVETLMDVIVFNFAPMLFIFFIATAALLGVNIETAATAAVMTIVFIIYSFIIQRRQFRYNVEANAAEDNEKGNMSDFLLNIESVKYFGKEEHIKKRYEELVLTTKKKYFTLWELFRYMDAGQALIIGASTLAVVYFSVKGLLAGTATVGEVAFVYTVFYALLSPLFGFVHGMRSFVRAMADFESLYEYDKEHNEIVDKPEAQDLRIKRGTVEFRAVSFKYHKKELFTDFSLTIRENEKVALVGHSGSGKTTLVKLLYRLYDVDKGAILIDGQDIRDVKQESLRSELSIVPQEALLFDDTVYNNIRFSDNDASDEKVRRAIRSSQLDAVIAGLPQKEHTIVGERGVKLSGGEKQRVSIARALIADKKILVLDEATSSLDSRTEHEIQKDLRKLMNGRTSIIIAHRLSTIMHADKIVVLSKGRIVQVGTHRQLIRKPGQYRELWALQKGGYIE